MKLLGWLQSYKVQHTQLQRPVAPEGHGWKESPSRKTHKCSGWEVSAALQMLDSFVFYNAAQLSLNTCCLSANLNIFSNLSLKLSIICGFLFCFLVVLGFEHRTCCLLGRCSTRVMSPACPPHQPPLFFQDPFQIGPWKLFALGWL
jgi:hypothetical protein